MGIRSKLLLVLIVVGFAPMVLLGVLLYRASVESVEANLRMGVERDASGIALKIETALREDEAMLAVLASSPALRSYVRGGAGLASRIDERSDGYAGANASEGGTQRDIPAAVKESIRAFLLSGPNRYSRITCLSSSGMPLFRSSLVFQDDGVGNGAAGTDVDFKTEGILGGTASVDARVLTTSAQTPLLSPLARGANGAALRYLVPVFTVDARADAPRGVLIAELNVNALFDDATTARFYQRLDAPGASDTTSQKRFIIVVDNAGGILYHTNEALRHQQVDSVMPSFKDISSAMIAGQSGWKFFDKEDSSWLVAYRPLPMLAASVGVAGDYTAATSSVKRMGWITFILFSLFGLATTLVLARLLRNTARSIERVTEGAVAIARGRLEQRIEVLSNDETRLLAESFNIMTDRLREQIARETESRQFESFMRLSAMLTHDLKNAIAGLSLLVSNMERQFDREEFRADAMKSLTEATNKLRNLVAKLSEPVQSLSSEHQMARPIDLVPIITKVLITRVEPASVLHELEVHLPESLVATVEADRIEKVFENLIMNALEAMGAKSGKLTVEAGHTQQGEVFFSVSDTGPGISAEFQQSKLFRPFATTKKTGIGLGLYACREIVQAHGGTIDVTSERGSGATFRAVLPSESKITEST